MMKILLKILVAPFALALSLLAALLVFLFDICACLLTIASVILAVLGIALFFTPTPIGGIVFLFLAFLLSPYGLQAAAGSLLWALDGGKSALYRFLASKQPRAILARSRGGLNGPPLSHGKEE